MEIDNVIYISLDTINQIGSLTQGAKAYPRVEVDIGIQFAFDEVLVRQRDAFQLHGQAREVGWMLAV